jgi:hypothetical protein
MALPEIVIFPPSPPLPPPIPAAASPPVEETDPPLIFIVPTISLPLPPMPALYSSTFITVKLPSPVIVRLQLFIKAQ